MPQFVFPQIIPEFLVFRQSLVLIPAVYKLVKPLLTRKVQTEKNIHVKQGLEVGLNLANTIVPEIAVMAGLWCQSTGS